ncbi:MAG: M28 family metallopeptidase [Acidobacteriota bacterium]|nr:M28 family metallopeptidase [Acidobacteriota bacterium]
MHTLQLIYKLLLLSVLCFSTESFGQQTDSPVSTEESIAESVKLAPCKKEERLESVKKLFAQMGAKDDEITIEKFNKDKISNVVVRKKGKSDETIVVGAHYDKTDDGCGAIDNWTGITIITHLFKTLRRIETEKSYVFVAFDQEEKGLLGSEAMAKVIPKEKRGQYCAMVNFDSFGFASPMILQNASSFKMISAAKKLGKENDFKLIDAEIIGADADSSSFKSRDIPAITFGGLDGSWRNFLHTRNDKIEKINMKSVYLGYRFGLMFISRLDSTGCQEIR